jgi:hypothetical protein
LASNQLAGLYFAFKFHDIYTNRTDLIDELGVTVGYTLFDHKQSEDILKELQIEVIYNVLKGMW